MVVCLVELFGGGSLGECIWLVFDISDRVPGVSVVHSLESATDRVLAAESWD